MSRIYFDVDKRNLELIQTLMEIVGVADCEELPNKVNELKRAAELSRAPVQSEQGGASKLVCTFDNDGGGVDVDILKKFLRGQHGWLTAKSFANGQIQFFVTPHPNRSDGG